MPLSLVLNLHAAFTPLETTSVRPFLHNSQPHSELLFKMGVQKNTEHTQKQNT